MNNEIPFKVKCVDATHHSRLTEGEQYEVEHIAYEIGAEYYQVRNDNGVLEFCDSSRFEIVENPKNKQEFSIGDKVVVNKISDDFVSDNDDNVKVGDVLFRIFIPSIHPKIIPFYRCEMNTTYSRCITSN